MKPILLAVLTWAILVLCNCEKTDPEIREMSAVRGYENWFIGEFRCGLFIPPSYNKKKKYPLIIYLHGHTDTTTWNLEWYNEPIVSGDPCIVLTPKCPREEIYGWGDSFDPRTSPMMAKTYEMLDKVEEAFNLDKDRYYIYGTSMGGYGTYGAIQKNPDLFAAGYSICGEPNVEIAPIIAQLPFWIFHGSADPIVPVQPDRDLYRAVLDLGGTQIRYTEYEGVGHNAWDYTEGETTLASWLLAQRKGSVHNAPQEVNNFRGELINANKVFLQWDVPAENLQEKDNKVWYCIIYKNGEAFKEIYNTINSCIDSSLSLGITCEYNISAVNYYFRESALTETLSFTVE